MFVFCIVIIMLLLIFIIYAIIPFILTRIIKLGSIHQLENGSRKISLTFDDGPHPVYTPMFLDLLNKHSIKVTFFVVGSEAENIQTLLKECMMKDIKSAFIIIDIPVIGFYHQRRLKNLEQTANVIKNITNIEPIFYRPPWGLVALPTLF